MKYFTNIKSFSDLKKQFRALVIANHPDKGGSTEVMQEINKEFEQLYNIWKDRKDTEQDTTGYANDYEGASANEYSKNVYEEYGWTGSRRDRWYSRDELKKIFAKWLKETYKNCTFSINLNGYKSIKVCLLKSDFNPFKGAVKYSYSFSRYNINEDDNLNDRAKEMFSNIRSFCMSYNYDRSDVYSDYYDVGFYFDIEIGSGKTPFKVDIPKDRRASGSVSPEFKYKEGPAHQAIKKVLGRQFFSTHTIYRGGDKGEHLVLGENNYSREEVRFYPLHYAGYKTMVNKIEKLLSVGIIAEPCGSMIKFVGYTPEVEKALAEEDRAKEAAYKAWQEAQKEGPKAESKKKNTNAENREQGEATDSKSEQIGSFTIIDYTEKAFVVLGDSYDIKDLLKQNGGRPNRALTIDGKKRSGWVFSKKRLASVRAALAAYDTREENAKQDTQGQPEESQPEKDFVSILELIPTIIDAAVELIGQKKESETTETESFAAVLQAFPAILDSICQAVKESPRQHKKQRQTADNDLYNGICAGAINAGRYQEARQAIKEAISRYKFSGAQLRYFVYLLNHHPGIIRPGNRSRGAA